MVTFSAWSIWLTIAAILLIIELLSGTAAALCLAAGCLIAIVPAIMGLGIVWQVTVAVAASVAALIFLGPAVRRLYARNRNPRETASNMDALIGRIGKVTHRVTNLADDHGRVQIDGDSWLAYTNSPEQPLERGSQVIVESYDSIVICVKPLRKA